MDGRSPVLDRRNHRQQQTNRNVARLHTPTPLDTIHARRLNMSSSSGLYEATMVSIRTGYDSP